MKYKCPHCKKEFKRDMRLKENQAFFLNGLLRTFCDKTGISVRLKPLNK